MGNWWIKDTELMKHFQNAPNSDVFKNNLRSRFAVKEKWNPGFEYLLTIQLIQPVLGWVGKTRFQSSSIPGSNIIYMGQGIQCYVPNLSPPNDMINSDYVTIVKYEDTQGMFW
jgi:hypothetical protein